MVLSQAYAGIEPVFQVGHVEMPGIHMYDTHSGNFFVTYHNNNKHEFKVWNKENGLLSGVYNKTPYISENADKIFLLGKKTLTVKDLKGDAKDVVIDIPEYRQFFAIDPAGDYYGLVQVYVKDNAKTEYFSRITIRKISDSTYEKVSTIDGVIRNLIMNYSKAGNIVLEKVINRKQGDPFSGELLIYNINVDKGSIMTRFNLGVPNRMKATYDFENDRVLVLFSSWEVLTLGLTDGELHSREKIEGMDKQMIYTVDETLNIEPVPGQKDMVVVQTPTDAFYCSLVDGKVKTRILKGKEPKGLSVTKDGKYAYIYDRWGYFEKYELATGNVVQSIPPTKFIPISKLNFSKDMKVLYSDDYVINLEDMQSNENPNKAFREQVKAKEGIHTFAVEMSNDPQGKTYLTVENITAKDANGQLIDPIVYLMVRNKSDDSVIKKVALTDVSVFKNEQVQSATGDSLLKILSLNTYYDEANGVVIVNSDKGVNCLIDMNSGIKTDIKRSEYTPVKNSRYIYKVLADKSIAFYSIQDLTAPKFVIKVDGYIGDAMIAPSGDLIAIVSGAVKIFDSVTHAEKYSKRFNFMPTNIAYNDLYKVYAVFSKDSKMYFFDTDWNIKATTLIIDAENSLTYTKNGIFGGTGNVYKYVHFVDERLNVYDVRQFAATYYRPEMIAKILSGNENDLVSIEEMYKAKPAPVVSIGSVCGGVTNEEQYQLAYNIKDNGGGVGSVMVYVNGALVSTDGRALKTKGIQQQQNIMLSTGKNHIEIIAFNGDNSLAGKPVSCNVTGAFDAAKPVLYVYAIGIDSYENPNLNLRFAGADAQYFAENIGEKAGAYFKDVQVKLVKDMSLTSKEGIKAAMDDAAKTVKPDDYFIFYVASHGDMVKEEGKESRYYLISSNVVFIDPQNLAQDAISQDELVEMIGNIQARNKIIFMDTCHSGQAGKQIQKMLFRGMSEKTAVELIRVASGSSVFTASQKTEMALEGYKGHGLFTYTLVEGLLGAGDKDKDGVVSLSELKSFVERTVFKRSKEKFNSVQIPYINIGSLDIPIAKVAN